MGRGKKVKCSWKFLRIMRINAEFIILTIWSVKFSNEWRWWEDGKLQLGCDTWEKTKHKEKVYLIIIDDLFCMCRLSWNSLCNSGWPWLLAIILLLPQKYCYYKYVLAFCVVCCRTCHICLPIGLLIIIPYLIISCPDYRVFPKGISSWSY